MNRYLESYSRSSDLLLIFTLILGISQVSFSQDNSSYCFCEKMKWEVKATGLDEQLAEFENPDEGEELNGLKEFVFETKEYSVKLEEPVDVFVSASIFPPRVWSSVKNKEQTKAKKCEVKWGKGSMAWDNLMVKRGDMPAEYKLIEDKLHIDSDLGMGYIFMGVFQIIDESKGEASLLFEGVTHYNPEAVYEILGVDRLGNEIVGDEIETHCWKAICRTPIKVTWTWDKDSIDPDDEVIYTPRGTGNTTGEVVVVDLSNPTDREITGTINPSLIPPTGKYQGYLIPDSYDYTIPAGESVSIPLYGYCTDIHRKAVPQGESIIDFDEWIDKDDKEELPEVEDPVSFVHTYAKAHPGMEHKGGVPVGGTMCYYPGTDVSLPYTIDINKHPETAAPFLFSGLDRIISTYEDLYDKGLISTPFSAEPAKEKESVIQQTFWLYTSGLTGDDYKITDLDKNLVEQFETISGEKVSKEQRKELEEGATVLWNTFSLVGEDAKVLKDNNIYFTCYKAATCGGDNLGRVNSASECSEMKGASMSSGVKDDCNTVPVK